MTDEQRRELIDMVSRRPGIEIRNAVILLGLQDGMADEALARLLHCHRNTIANVRTRFLSGGLVAAIERKPGTGVKRCKSVVQIPAD